MTPEERMARLEENAFFQERLVGELNAALTDQQRQIDSLERDLREARAQLEELKLLLDDGGVATPPPHYQM